MAEVAAVLLAAGASTRFGPGNKLVARIGAPPLVRCVAETIAASGVAEIVVVTGADAEAIERALEGIPVRFAHTARWKSGMGSSIAAGVSALGEHVDGTFIVPGDMPLLRPQLLQSLRTAFEREGALRIVYPATPEGAQRNPVLWPRRHFPLLTALGGQAGAKSLLKRFSDSCTVVTVADESIFADVDTLGDLAVARARAENR